MEYHNLKSRFMEARKAGDKYYFTGKPCKKGHVSKRLTSNGKCCICNNSSARDWQKDNPERFQEIVHSHRNTPLCRYTQHKNRASRCRIEFKLTFEEWWQIWEDSGRYAERGAFRGGYVMSRKEDKGAYEAGNVFIQRHEDNAKQGALKTRNNKDK